MRGGKQTSICFRTNRSQPFPLKPKETMRSISIILILILASCKDVKTDKTANEMWNNFTKANSEFLTDEMPEADYFHTNKEDANRLGELILNRQKQAGSSLYALYEKYNADLPKIGRKQIVTDFDGNALAIIETIKVDTIPFNQISAAYAKLDMGTNSEPLKKWKKAHWDFFEGFMAESGDKPTEDMLIVCEWFETIWPEKD